MDSFLVPFQELVRQLSELANLIMSLVGTMSALW